MIEDERNIYRYVAYDYDILAFATEYYPSIESLKENHPDRGMYEVEQASLYKSKTEEKTYTKEEIKVKGLEFLKWLARDHNHRFVHEGEAWEYWCEENI